MNKLLQKMGVVAWWAVLPALIVYLGGRPRTRAVLRCDGKIVAVKGWLGNGKWSLPGGGLHRGEDPLAGVLREVREEAGLRLQPGQLTRLATEPSGHHGIRFPCHYFAADLSQEAPLTAQFGESTEAAWLETATLGAHNANPDVLAGLRLAVPKNSQQ
ncbi:MAG TPA: NUDIX hydrolase [Candidatus Saccharimonadales bacterium]|nr:NUDIX hydrolase [Candidatus Saccharimonadales bacterium]